MAGLFFCLASAEGAGLLFLSCCNTDAYKCLQRVLYRPCSYTTHAAKQHTWLYRGFSGHLPYFVPIIRRCILLCRTACATLERITAPQHLQCIPDTNATPGRCTGQHSRPIIIRYIRVQGCPPVMDLCQTVQQTADHASPAGSALTVCGSLASAAPGAPAEGSASPSVQGQPGGLQSGTGQRSGRGSPAVCGAEPLAALAAAFFGLSPDS